MKDNKESGRRKRGQRAHFHDYCAPGYYLITATVEEDIFPTHSLSNMPPVSHERLKNTEMIIPLHTKPGMLIQQEIESIPKFHPKLEVKRYVIMPDHIHLVIFVKERMERKLGSELAGFFGACTRKFREHIQTYNANISISEIKGINISDEEKKDSAEKRLFLPFHDRIIFNYNQLKRSIL